MTFCSRGSSWAFTVRREEVLRCSRPSGLSALRHGRLGPLVIGACGITLMAAALTVDHGPREALLTIAGVGLVAAAHIRNLRQPG